MRRQVLFFASATLTVLLAGSASRANLIVNGDFELGNVGFSSGYTFLQPMFMTYQPMTLPAIPSTTISISHHMAITHQVSAI